MTQTRPWPTVPKGVVGRRPSTNPPADVQPLADYGFFGPDSVSWKVWSYGSSMLIGFARAVAIEHLDPQLAAAVDHTGQVRKRTAVRFDRTMQYFANVVFGDAKSVLESSEILMKIHERSVGTDPVTGRTYDANEPEQQRWIHLTAWHSILYSYEVFGPGKLTPSEESRYWEECALAAQFQTIDPDLVPRTRQGIEEYFDSYRPNMVASDVAVEMFKFLVELPRNTFTEQLSKIYPRPVAEMLGRLLTRAIIATLPRWMRDMVGLPQSRATDAATVAVLKPGLLALQASTPVVMTLIGTMTAKTYPIAAPAYYGVQPVNPRVYTIAEARAELGHPKSPREMYADIVAARQDGTGQRPYDAAHDDELVAFRSGRPAGSQEEIAS